MKKKIIRDVVSMIVNLIIFILSCCTTSQAAHLVNSAFEMHTHLSIQGATAGNVHQCKNQDTAYKSPEAGLCWRLQKHFCWAQWPPSFLEWAGRPATLSNQERLALTGVDASASWRQTSLLAWKFCTCSTGVSAKMQWWMVFLQAVSSMTFCVSDLKYACIVFFLKYEGWSFPRKRKK